MGKKLPQFVGEGGKPMAVQQTVPQEEVLSFPEPPLPAEAPAPEQQSAPSPKSPETEPPPPPSMLSNKKLIF